MMQHIRVSKSELDAAAIYKEMLTLLTSVFKRYMCHFCFSKEIKEVYWNGAQK